MKYSILITGIIFATSGAMTVQAGILGLSKKDEVVTPVQNNKASALSQLATLKSQASNSDLAPIEIYQLKAADCTDLSVHVANAKREMKSLLEQADNYDATQEQVSAVQAENKGKGGFLSGLVGVASFAGKAAALATGDPSLIQMSNQVSNLTNSFSSTMSEVNNTQSSLSKSSAISQVNVSELEADYIVKRYKKHEADLENIKIYQMNKQCS